MGKYLKLFNLQNEYDSFILTDEFVLPNVSYITENEEVNFNPYVITGYLTFEAIEDSTFTLTKNACEYSLDEGKTWDSLAAGTNTPTVPAGSKIMFKATNPTITSSNGMGTFSSTGKFNVEGNVMSMLYGDDFIGQIDLTGKNYAFYGLFSGCTTVVEAHKLILPATTLSDYCYQYMFNTCSSLTTAPELPATTLASSCYSSMFSGCSKLTTAPELPATKLAYYCYRSMFLGCTSLSTAPELPATTLTSECYSYMFSGCTSLTTAPSILPATTLPTQCYYGMFDSCKSLTTAPELPATTLSYNCYKYMFYNCSSLTTAPELHATTLDMYCYQSMFKGCSNINRIVMLATDISATRCLDDWVNGVASTGTFVKHESMTSLPSGASGIPEGWEVKDTITPTECTSLTITADDVIGNKTTTTIHYTAIRNGIDYKGNTVTGIVEEGTAVSAEFPQNTSETETVERTITFEFMGVTASTVITQGVWVVYEKRHLTFESIEDSTFTLTKNACQYSLDEGETWVSLAAGIKTPTVPAGSKIMFKATSPTISSKYGIGKFSSTGKFNVYGNIMSLLYGDNFIDKNNLTGKDYAFYKLFSGCTTVVEAHNLILPATTLSNECYEYMFYNCSSLTTAPELPATTLSYACYQTMFFNCIRLTTAPELPATTLATSCYSGMFYGCSSLNNIVMLATDISAYKCLDDWVNGVASTGTFTKSASMTSLPSGASGIPSGWTVENA